MSILSLEFLVFSAGAALLYYCLPLKIRWTVLLAGSAAYTALAGQDNQNTLPKHLFNFRIILRSCNQFHFFIYLHSKTIAKISLFI